MSGRICDSTFVTGSCVGHLGKFDSCEDEAIFWQSLDQAYWEDTTGDSEFRGYFALMHYDEDENVKLDDPDDRTVTVPAGWYIVVSENSGAVSVVRYDTEAEARVVFDAEAEEYEKWSDDDGEF